MIRGIAAVGPNGVLGWNNELIYRNKQDLARFKNLTLGRNILMGRKTWESIGSKPLPGRKNWVLSKSLSGPNVLHNCFEAFNVLGDDFDVIGGESLFSQLRSEITHLELTVFSEWAEGDTYFPMDMLQYFSVTKQEHCTTHSFYSLKAN